MLQVEDRFRLPGHDARSLLPKGQDSATADACHGTFGDLGDTQRCVTRPALSNWWS